MNKLFSGILLGGGGVSDEDTGRNMYTNKVKCVQYMPSLNRPTISQIIDTRKYEQLIQEINASSVTEYEKQFLRLCAARHIQIDFSKAADYYANSNKELQELMEKNALVIIDFDDALKNGFVELSKTILKDIL